MDLSQLSQFRVLARVQHMTRAAEELGVAQPSLSKTIKRLEDELGVALFDRPGRQIRLNALGKAYLEQIDQAFFALEEGRRQVRDRADLDRGEIALAAEALHWLPDLLRDFKSAHPAARFRLFQRAPDEFARLISAREIDFGFASDPLIFPGATWQHVLTEEVYLMLPRGHRWAGRESIPLGEVRAEGIVTGRRGSTLRDRMDASCRQAGFAPQIVCESDEGAAVRDFVASGLGVAFIPALMRAQWGEQDLCWLHLTDPACTLTLGMVWHEAHHLTDAAKAFRAFVARYFDN